MSRRSRPDGKRRVRNWMCVIYSTRKGMQARDRLGKRTWINPEVVAFMSNHAASSPMAQSVVSLVSLSSNGGMSTAM